ncbi:hypothetical protein [Reichenbachiella versicolor]|uniref:hypothetical protein n=1 Tax=Reichenbachiella versicolor TaxID=1821036 RepID=UPI000D6DD06F|nr:hypothetical protein [Reichenbachiella versicolor]
MIKIIKFKYWASVPIFLATILYVYALLPTDIGVMYDDNGSASYSINKSYFFYAYFALFILTNGLIRAYQHMILPKSEISMESYDQLSKEQKIYHWWTGLSLVFNVIYIFSSFYIGLYNSRDVNPDHYVALVYLCPIILIGWVFYFFYLKFISK